MACRIHIRSSGQRQYKNRVAIRPASDRAYPCHGPGKSGKSRRKYACRCTECAQNTASAGSLWEFECLFLWPSTQKENKDEFNRRGAEEHDHDRNQGEGETPGCGAWEKEESRADPRDPGCRRVYALLRSCSRKLPVGAMLLEVRLFQGQSVIQGGRVCEIDVAIVSNDAGGGIRPDFRGIFLSTRVKLD